MSTNTKLSKYGESKPVAMPNFRSPKYFVGKEHLKFSHNTAFDAEISFAQKMFAEHIKKVIAASPQPYYPKFKKITEQMSPKVNICDLDPMATPREHFPKPPAPGGRKLILPSSETDEK